MPALKHKLLHCVCQGESGSQASEVGVPSLESLAACDKQSLCSGQQMASPTPADGETGAYALCLASGGAPGGLEAAGVVSSSSDLPPCTACKPGLLLTDHPQIQRLHLA